MAITGDSSEPIPLRPVALREEYGDITAGHRSRLARRIPVIEAELGMVVEDADEVFCGAVVAFEKATEGDLVRLEDRFGKTRVFPMREAAFQLDGALVTLTKPKTPTPAAAPARTASGSRAVAPQRARVARASRIWVEGIHDAALVERVWGEDLRIEGVVVEPIDGLDNLPGRVAEFEPAPGRRLGVLADHLIEGTKESRLATGLGPNVLVTGHPYVDIWEAVRPASLGIAEWPRVPRGEDWKTGVCRRLGWGTPQDGWRRVNAAVHTYRDVETPLITAVERLVDFVTEPV